MPLIRRLPKRGFNNARHTTRYIPVNLEALNRFDDGIRVDEALLRSLGVANGPGDGIKILGQGELTKKLTISVHEASEGAKTKVAQAGGTVELVARVNGRAETQASGQTKARTSK